MLSGTRVLSMIGLYVTLAGWSLLPQRRPRQPQPVSPTRGNHVWSRDDRLLDGLPETLAVTELPGSD